MAKKPAFAQRARAKELRQEATPSRFGQLLRLARLDQGKTLNDVSLKSDISVTYLSDLERGVLVNPTLDTLRRVAKALDVSLNELLELEPSQSRTYPQPLREFSELPQLNQALEDQSTRFKVSKEELLDEWLSLLAGIRLQGRRPRTAMDYFFLFDAMSRTM